MARRRKKRYSRRRNAVPGRYIRSKYNGMRFPAGRVGYRL